MSLSRALFMFQLTVFRVFVECIFMILLQIMWENNFLPTS